VRWPLEALKAQAVAARTYALHTLETGPAGAAETYGFDICASVECQVFAGADVIEGIKGKRWLRAVQETAGRALLYERNPILARYHSTSGGRTLANEQVFTDERAYPYLKGVESTAETESPLYRWTVYFRLDRLRAILRAAGTWQRGWGRLLEVRSRPSRANLHYPDVVLRGARGHTVVTAEGFRGIVGDLAPDLYPKQYPSPWATPSGFLPETLPSNRFEVATSRNSVIVEGRGWGHGVGMSQWGAYGMARAGSSYEEILGHYYTDIEIDEVDTDLLVDVGIDWARTEVSARGAFKIVDGQGRVLQNEAIGNWRFAWLSDGRVAIEPPEGIRRPLRVGVSRAPDAVTSGGRARLTIDLSRPARVYTITSGDPSSEVDLRGAGRSRLRWTAPEDPGRYRVAVRAAIGSRTKDSKALTIVVTAPEAGTEGRGPDVPPRTMNFLLIAILTIILAGIVWAGRIRA
jgi:SpoIID/LytB domain protein